jgi:hypothetical protein
MVTAFAHSFGTPATIPITTGTASAGGYEIGTAVMKDSALLAGNVTSDRTINFFLWSPSSASCTGTPVFTDSVPAKLPGPVETATAYTGTAPQAPEVVGTYQWTANIAAPDGGAIEATSTCGDEPVKLVAVPPVSKASPSITTTPSAGGVTGTHISDSATLTGGVSPTGTVVFKLYGPTNPPCSAAAVFTSTVTLPAALTSAVFSGTSTAGTYSWTAEYSGDDNNNPASSLCADETVVITSITSSGQGVQGLTTVVTTPGTGGDAAVGKLTVGGFLLLGGLGVALFGYMIPRRRRINS